MEKIHTPRGTDISLNEITDHGTCSNCCSKLGVYDWVQDLPDTMQVHDVIEVQFKNTRKGFYRNVNNITLKKGDIVAVEASPGHDIGVVSLTGWLVERQMKRMGIDPKTAELKKVYRRAKKADIEKWVEAMSLEHDTMLKSRKIAEDLKLDMKIGDVEYQGDKTKAIFYYIADERVDFRELIKVLADRFKIRVEMRQIGARQEAGRIGGIGTCGRELCCSTWIAHFESVTTNSAKAQELSLNPQKLAGQCGKLKCCLNYELASYLDARKDFPEGNIQLETKDATYYHFKTDIFKRSMWFGSQPSSSVNLLEIPVDRVNEIIELNKKGIKPDTLLDSSLAPKTEVIDIDFTDGLEDDNSLTRFDKKRSKPKLKKRKKSKNQNKSNRNGKR
ncbi:MAG: hypothetical protein PWR03_67 [Tenuifilum sp.]|jgi:cell fate regulator YaaT (PSP1 superfamily)|uniref:PSP1 domain-containing protein n=1 Tax=Tenuifilum sp. TaxID=2760880 RepID=UPI0024AC589A|nr:regulatory iron-sulfur-containing complex subunit RicT [Tenuifilum sp.]MDI3525884.1 hypothetical protein [Tenuifilum sp.]